MADGNANCKFVMYVMNPSFRSGFTNGCAVGSIELDKLCEVIVVQQNPCCKATGRLSQRQSHSTNRSLHFEG